MKHRNPLVVVLLSIITLGIYDLYWLAQSRKILNSSTNYKTPSVWFLIAPFVVVIVSYIGLIANMPRRTVYGTTPTTLHAPLLIWLAILLLGSFVTFVITIWWFFQFSKAVNQYTNGKMTTAVTFLVLWVIHLIGVALVQDAFNDMNVAQKPIANGLQSTDVTPLMTPGLNPINPGTNQSQQPPANEPQPNIQPLSTAPTPNVNSDNNGINDAGQT